MKSMNMISITGRIPISAAPVAAPAMAASEMGVSRIRSGPNSSNMPRDTPKAPPYTPTSSPMRKTSGSRRISWIRASRTASR